MRDLRAAYDELANGYEVQTFAHPPDFSLLATVHVIGHQDVIATGTVARRSLRITFSSSRDWTSPEAACAIALGLERLAEIGANGYV